MNAHWTLSCVEQWLATLVVIKDGNGESTGGVFKHYNRVLIIRIETAQKNYFLRHFFIIFRHVLTKCAFHHIFDHFLESSRSK